MLIRISLIIAIIAALAAGGLNIGLVKDKITTLTNDRNTQRDGRIAAEGERDKTKKELVKTQDTLKQTTQDLADTKTELDKEVATATAQQKRADDLSDKLAKTSQERDDAQTKLAAYAATGMTADQVGKLSRSLKDTTEALAVAKEEKVVLQRVIDRLNTRL